MKQRQDQTPLNPKWFLRSPVKAARERLVHCHTQGLSVKCLSTIHSIWRKPSILEEDLQHKCYLQGTIQTSKKETQKRKVSSMLFAPERHKSFTLGHPEMPTKRIQASEISSALSHWLTHAPTLTPPISILFLNQDYLRCFYLHCFGKDMGEVCSPHLSAGGCSNTHPHSSKDYHRLINNYSKGTNILPPPAKTMLLVGGEERRGENIRMSGFIEGKKDSESMLH